jgi:hypothetical protein
MAGSAMAAGSRLVNETGSAVDQINLTASDSTVSDYVILGYQVTGISGYVPTTFSYGIPSVTVMSGSGDEDDITVEYLNHNSFYVSSGDSYIDPANIKITLSADSEDTGTRYNVKIPVSVGGTSTTATFEIAASSTIVTGVPEFPTVALPIAAVIGLVFIFGRKKEGL